MPLLLLWYLIYLCMCVCVCAKIFCECCIGRSVLKYSICNVVTDSKSATESADSSRVRPSLNPRIFFAAISDGFGSSVRKSIFTYQVAAFKRRCITVSGRQYGHVRD